DQYLLAVDRLTVVAADGLDAVLADRRGAVAPDLFAEVSLRVHVDLLGARGILEAQLVEAVAAGRAAGADRRLRLGVGQRDADQRLAVVDAAGHERSVWVTADELDDHLHAHARDEQHPEAAASPAVGDADPHRRVVGER